MDENSGGIAFAEKYALESMDSGVLLLDCRGKIVYANETAETIFVLASANRNRFSTVICFFRRTEAMTA